MTIAYDFTLTNLRGETLPLGDFAGRPMLIANTASLCAFTPQYAGLQQLWHDYGDRGLLVLAVPSNDFGKQEPGDAGTIGACCDGRFGISFPIAGKSAVKGEQAIPLFRWLAQQAGFMGQPRWNFYKYLIGRDGHLVAWYSSLTRPDTPRVRIAIERCLATA